jgi:hypothetical protein
MKNCYLVACVVSFAAFDQQTRTDANTIIFNNDRQTGNQWGYTVGMDFTVNSTVSVTALGTFDSNISGLTDPVTTAQINTSLEQGISSGDAPHIQVAIYNVNTGTQVSPVVSFFYNDPNIANYYAIAGSIFQNITPFSLPPGTYSIVAAGYNYALAFGDIKDLNVNPPLTPPTFDTLLGALTLTGDARSNGNGSGTPGLGFPTDYTESESSPDFLAGTFIAVNGVPDAGSTLSLLGVALLGVEGLRRKFSR